MDILYVLLVGAIAGWLAGQLFRGFGFGIIGNIVVGILGGFVGYWLLPKIGVSFGMGVLGQILTAAIGAVVLLAVIGLFRRATA